MPGYRPEPQAPKRGPCRNGFSVGWDAARSTARDSPVTKQWGSDLGANSLERTPAMAYSEFRSAKKLLPALLSKLAKQSGSAKGLAPVWAEAAGDVFAKTCSPLRV